jgi:carbon storage regulator CsrA
MLIIARRIGESFDLKLENGLVIASVTITDIKGKQASIGIKADPSIVIHRDNVKNTLPGKDNNHE